MRLILALAVVTVFGYVLLKVLFFVAMLAIAIIWFAGIAFAWAVVCSLLGE